MLKFCFYRALGEFLGLSLYVNQHFVNHNQTTRIFSKTFLPLNNFILKIQTLKERFLSHLLFKIFNMHLTVLHKGTRLPFGLKVTASLFLCQQGSLAWFTGRVWNVCVPLPFMHNFLYLGNFLGRESTVFRASNWKSFKFQCIKNSSQMTSTSWVS